MNLFPLSEVTWFLIPKVEFQHLKCVNNFESKQPILIVKKKPKTKTKKPITILHL